jgi:hypothetical protein
VVLNGTTLVFFSGMFVFWTLQTACFGLYSTTGNTQAAHTVIAMICTSTLCLSSIMILILCDIKVLFYGFCEYISAFFFCYLNHSDINFADDVRIFK